MATQNELIKAIKIKKGVLKGRLTKFKSYFNNIDKNKLNSSVIEVLSERLNSFESVCSEFIAYSTELQTISSDVSEEEILEAGQFEEDFFELMGNIKSLIKKYSQDELNDISSDSNSSRVQTNGVEGKLIPMQLPKFDGQYCNWYEFRDAFMGLVHNNKQLSDYQKFYYLKQALGLEAQKCIKSLQVTAANYNIALKRLQTRYENEDMIAHNHIKNIFECLPLEKESASALRNLYEQISNSIDSLAALGENVNSWDRLIIYIMQSKFDSITRREWGLYKCADKKATLKDIETFIIEKCENLERLSSDQKLNSKKQTSTMTIFTDNVHCIICNDANHNIQSCDQFLKLSVKDRYAKAKERHICFNCLKSGHAVWRCKAKKCNKCYKSHHYLLHYDKQKISQANNIVAEFNKQGIKQTVIDNDIANLQMTSNNTTLVGKFNSCLAFSEVLLSTALIRVKINSDYIYGRALLDSGSQTNFISERFRKKLNIESTSTNHIIRGVGKMKTSVQNQVNIIINSCYNAFSVEVKCLVLAEVTCRLPTISFDETVLELPENIMLADPNFNISDDIDLILGSQIFWSCLLPEKKYLGNNKPILQNSYFGWILAGNLELVVKTKPKKDSISCHCELNNELILKFWEIEEKPNITSFLNNDELYCEKHFRQNIRRDETGRFIVKMPFKNNLNNLGLSNMMAYKRFLSLEKRLLKNKELRDQYNSFMKEYIELDHMTKIENGANNNEGYFIPHHAIIRPDSLTTKCRVVFDASAKTSTGLSLNDVQFVGRVFQQDIFQILTRFRKYNYVMTADVSKMYRQILIDENQRKYLKIFWRFDENDDLCCYTLNTVTYGTASAPHLAVSCLLELSKQNKVQYPAASKRIKCDFYMDDLLSGADTIEQLLQYQKQIFDILKSAGFILRKWLSNDKEAMSNFVTDENIKVNLLKIGENEPCKTLGIYWEPIKDEIRYIINLKNEKVYSKRKVLALLCQVFDPLGLLGPIVVVAKLIMQELWRNKVDWDSEIPDLLAKEWNIFYNQLKIINDFCIPRQVTTKNVSKIELHGFTDASEKAYGACIFLRSIDIKGNVTCNLLAAKSRVAPLKKISLPRLELCGALLLSQLVKRIVDSIEISFDSIYLWTDSTITLCWIRGDSSRWHTFVANRTTEIHSLTNINNWHHVLSIHNPADVLSRGTTPNELQNNKLWWHGPSWLLDDSSTWCVEEKCNILDVPEVKISVHVSSNEYHNDLIDFLLIKYSKFTRLIRITAYILRFSKNVKSKLNIKSVISVDQIYPLTVEELTLAEIFLIKEVQQISYSNEYNALVNAKNVSERSSIFNLNPFLKDGIVRVGGRLKNSNQSYENKFPIILPKSHNFTYLFVRHEHERLFHCGNQQLISNIRERFWIPSIRSTCKKILKNCIVCLLSKPKPMTYLMGDLPNVRVNQYSPFLNVGIDYGGPFTLKDRKTRNTRLIKGYLCLFVCLSTRAIHLELVTDLTSEAFISALKRFISRRGKPANIFSDNGRNFVKANRDLIGLYKFLLKNNPEISIYLSNERIQWKFIPAHSPNFGGIWESGIKSTKTHLKRVVGKNSYTYEDFMTILIQIEGVLNSRPLIQLTSDPNDLNSLTPGHFLIGRNLSTIPEPTILDTPGNRLKRFQLLQQVVQHFWTRWSKEYLVELQVRTKWKKMFPEVLKVGSLVLLQSDNQFVSDWQLARVTKLYPGPDGVTRIVDLKVRSGELQRPVTKICVLPIE